MCLCGGGSLHQHGYVKETPLIQSLHEHIDLSSVQCLNVKTPLQLEKIFRPKYDLVSDYMLESDVDPQILIKIPLDSSVKIKSICLHGPSNNSAPSELHLYANQPDLDFSSIERISPTQQWKLVNPDKIKDDEPVEYAARVAKLNNVSHITIFIPRNYGGETTKISYIGIYGEFMLKRANPIVDKYELLPNPADHKKGDLLSATTSKQQFGYIAVHFAPEGQTEMDDVRAQLTDFGFNPNRIERALKATKKGSLQDALDWIEAHSEDPNIDDPIEEETVEKTAEADENGEDGEESLSGSQCLKCNECGKKFTSVAFAQLHASKTGHEDFSETTEVIPMLTEEEKKQRLEELRGKLAEKRKQDELKREEENRQNELIRRKATKDSAEIRRQLEEKDMKKELEKRIREKQEEKVLRARIKAQIEDDRQRLRERAEEEKRRSQGIQEEQKQFVKPIIEESSIHSDSVRLQIRLPDGRALRETLPASQTLSDLLQLVATKSGLSTEGHGLMFAPSQKIFDAESEAQKTLSELGLCPSASLIFRKL